MKAKKILALLLVASMVFMIVACASDPAGTTTPTPAPSESPTPAPADPDDDDDDDQPVASTDVRDKWDPIDMGITIVRGANFEQGSDFSDMEAPDPAVDTAIAFARYDNFRRVEEKYNIRVETVILNFGDILPQLALAKMSGDDFVDLVWFNSQFVTQSVANDLVYDIPSIAPPDASYVTDEIYLHSPGPVLGKNVFLAENRAMFNADYLIINQDIINQVGAPNPVDLYNEGRWTWDAFREIAQMATRDTNNSGEINQWGISGWFPWFSAAIVASNGAKLSDMSTMKVNFNSAPVLEAFQFIQDIAVEDRTFFMPESDGMFEIWDWGATMDAFKGGNIAMAATRFWNDQGQDYAWTTSVVPMPTGPSNAIDGPTYFIEIVEWVLSATSKNPTWVYMILEECQYWHDGDIEFAWSAEEDMIMECVQTIDDVWRVFDASKRYALDIMPWVQGGGLDGGVLWGLLNERETPAQIVTANEQVFQDTLDNALGAVDVQDYLDSLEDE